MLLILLEVSVKVKVSHWLKEMLQECYKQFYNHSKLHSTTAILQSHSNAPINVLPHLPQVRPSRGHGRELVSRFCPEGWEFCITSVF